MAILNDMSKGWILYEAIAEKVHEAQEILLMSDHPQKVEACRELGLGLWHVRGEMGLQRNREKNAPSSRQDQASSMIFGVDLSELMPPSSESTEQ